MGDEVRDVDSKQPDFQSSQGHDKDSGPPEVVHGIPFTRNQHPMWIYDLSTLAFLTVNNAAIRTYGYSEDEFLKMTVLDIRPKEEVSRFLESWRHRHETTAERWFHIGKDGIPFAVSITSWELTFQGHRAELVLARKDDLFSRDVQ
ncbi:MAG TPA: PAS domain S-box protein [Terriglobales bacterium]|nr:PAS domain S-box protein [Terriglobales bacterium]